MADLGKVIRKAVAHVDRLTGGLQDYIVQRPWIGPGNSSGTKDQYGPPIQVNAIVELSNDYIEMINGDQINIFASVTIPRPAPPNGAPGRTEPFDVRDKISLSDGTVGQIYSLSGFLDKATHRPFLTEFNLGRK